MKGSIYYSQVELLLNVLPFINKDNDFALKGGTAINFFVRDLPRLSVDIDLVFLPIKDRKETLSSITEKLRSIGNLIRSKIDGAKVFEQLHGGSDSLNGLQVETKNAVIKIETNTVIRGSVFEPELMRLCSKAEEMFELSLKVQGLSLPDLFGGKICAALDRQHPRDLFDIKLLFENEGLTDSIRKAFLVYLISHNRPIVELLNPNLIDLEYIYTNEFIGMIDDKIKLSELEDTRGRLIRIIRSSLTEKEIEFLLSFKNLDPKWELLEHPGINNLPSVQWKLTNLRAMKSSKHKVAYEKLKNYLMS